MGRGSTGAVEQQDIDRILAVLKQILSELRTIALRTH